MTKVSADQEALELGSSMLLRKYLPFSAQQYNVE